MTQEKKEERGADSQGHGEGLPRAAAAACPAGGRSTGEDGDTYSKKSHQKQMWK